MDSSPAPGRRIRRFELREELGRGGMGVVFKAWDATLQRFVAIKFLGSPTSSGGSVGSEAGPLMDRVLREARVASQIQHPNVVRTYEVLLEEERPCLVLEFIEGESLRAQMSRAPVSLAEAEGIAHGIARGLAAAHALSVVHGDVKPENVMIAKGGEPRLTDFGLGRFFDPEGASTLTGGIRGTPAYIAPELLHGEMPSLGSDVYAAGVLFYELFSGKRPFSGPTPAALFHSILHDPTPSLEANHPEIPVRIARVVDRMMARDPAARFSDGGSVVTALEEAASGRLPALPRVASSPASRKRGRVVSLTIAGSALAFVAFIVLRSFPLASGGGVPSSTLAGSVQDIRGGPVANALVTIDGHVFGVRTSTDGAFRGSLSDAKPRESVLLRVSHELFYTETRWVHLDTDSLETIPIVLRGIGRAPNDAKPR